MGAGGSSTSMPTEALVDIGGGDELHLACACVPQLTSCGLYMPEADGVELLPDAGNVCQPCLRMWEAWGCGRCPCGPGAICQPCLDSCSDSPF